jgi:hypothetical protein
MLDEEGVQFVEETQMQQLKLFPEGEEGADGGGGGEAVDEAVIVARLQESMEKKIDGNPFLDADQKAADKAAMLVDLVGARATQIRPGTRCVVSGLTKAAEVNGQECTVVKYLPDKGRYKVVMDGPGAGACFLFVFSSLFSLLSGVFLFFLPSSLPLGFDSMKTVRPQTNRLTKYTTDLNRWCRRNKEHQRG